MLRSRYEAIAPGWLECVGSLRQDEHCRARPTSRT